LQSTNSEIVFDALANALGSENVLQSEKEIERHSFDALRVHRGFPLPSRGFPPDFVVTPKSTEDVVELVKVAGKFEMPLVAWGSGTGLMGGAVAAKSRGVVVDFRKMDKILEISKEGLAVRVEVGASLGSVNKVLLRRRLVLGHDPWTRDYATIGGAISTNGMGYYGGKYGSMGEQVLGLKVVLAGGEVVETPSVPDTSTGIDLRKLFIGTEGCLGLIVEAAVRCFPKPEAEKIFAYSFKKFSKAFAAALKIRERGLIPATLDSSSQGYEDGETTLYVGFVGARKIVRVEEEIARSLLSSGGGSRLSEKEATTYWRERHWVADYYRKNVEKSPFSTWRGVKTFDFIHVALPAHEVLTFRHRVAEIARSHGITIEEYGVWIKPELMAVTFTREEEVPEENLRSAVDGGMRLAIKLGGSIEYCHGVGMRLSSLMGEQYGEGLEAMKKIKRALDPGGILNPGKLGLD
jgi:FAD/FMN-containing dehydrogenase